MSEMNDFTEQVKTFAKQCGADIVGMGDMTRFEGAPKQWDPRYIFPEAKVIIGLAFRIPRGSLRGVEEGTHFYQYPAMSYANINEVYAPTVLHKVSCFLEDYGYEGAPLRNFGGLGPESDMDRSTTESPDLGRRRRYSRPVRKGLPKPDVMLQFRVAAFICGMGEIGFSKMFLTPQFGPRQRFAFILTDAPLTADPIYDGPPICDRCKRCVAECPGSLSDTETVKVTVAGRELEWAKLDEWHCFHAYLSSMEELNPFLPPDAFSDMPDGDKILRGEKKLTPHEVQKVQERIGKYYPRPSGYFPAMCAGRGCIRACMIHLEEKNKIKNTFKQPFRKRKPWKLESDEKQNNETGGRVSGIYR